MPEEPKPKRNVYVGGLEEQVNEEILHAAFVPFGDIIEVIDECMYCYCDCFSSQVMLLHK